MNTPDSASIPPMVPSKFILAFNLHVIAAAFAWFLALTAPQAALAQTGRAVGPTMCACPGAHKPLGNNRTCEDACFGARSSSSSRPSSSSPPSGESIGTTLGTAIGKALFGSGSTDQTQPSVDVADQARQQSRIEALAANKQGIEFQKMGDWTRAVASYQEAANKAPYDQNIRENLANAQQALANQQARQARIQQAEQERQARQARIQQAEQERQAQQAQQAQQARESAERMQQSIQNFAQSLNASPVAGGLDFDGRTAGIAPGGSSGGLDFTAAIATPSRALPSGDPMVVDARNVPSGLPKSVDNAIPHTPSGERVRKGFQAIQAGDWKAALAWFQDAHNKEPNNPGIGRLVDLAKFTLEYRTRPKPMANSAPVQTTQLPNQNSAIKSTDSPVAKSGDPAAEPSDGFLARSAASRMAARARADAAFREYTQKYGDHDVIARARAVSSAARGEGYSDEELKAQLRKALIDYRKESHPNGHADSVGGSPAVEEITIGGKG